MVLFNIGESDFIGHMLLENPALFGNVDTDTDAMFSSWKKHKDQIDYFVKGVVDKNFEPVENFHGHIRIQHGQLP